MALNHIVAATTTLVKTGPGVLNRININTSAAGIITVYDSLTASGVVLAVFKSLIAEQSFIFNQSFMIGLTIVTAAASDLSVIYDVDKQLA